LFGKSYHEVKALLNVTRQSH